MDPEREYQSGERLRRRTFLIDRRFQLKWTAIIVLVGVVISAGLGYFILRLTSENTELLALDAAYSKQVAALDTSTIYYLIGFVLLMAIALFFWGILMTHRVAGPIFLVTRYLRQMAEGNLPRIRPLRRHDELRELFETFADMVAELYQKDKLEAKLIGQAAQELQEKGGQTETIQALEKLAEKKRSSDISSLNSSANV